MEPIPAARIARLRKQRAFLPHPSASKVRTSHLIRRREATMRRSILATALVAVFISYLGTPAAVKTGGYVPTDLVTNRSFTDKNGIPHTGQIQDANLLNPWGVTEIPTGMGSPFWISDNAAGVSTLYNVPASTPNTVNPLSQCWSSASRRRSTSWAAVGHRPGPSSISQLRAPTRDS